jgi:hypothetical protein
MYWDGTPGRIRTCDLRIRSPLLYPAELQAHQKKCAYHMHGLYVYKKWNKFESLYPTDDINIFHTKAI